MDKENHQGGRLSKLSPTDQRRIVNQITTGKLNNVVQATNYINTIIHDRFCPQNIRNTLKRNPLLFAVFDGRNETNAMRYGNGTRDRRRISGWIIVSLRVRRVCDARELVCSDETCARCIFKFLHSDSGS